MVLSSLFDRSVVEWSVVANEGGSMSRRLLCGVIVLGVTAPLFCSAVGTSSVAAATIMPTNGIDMSLFATCLVFLIPAGLTVIAVGASEEGRATTVAIMGLIAISLGVIAYALIGFGFQSGGLGLVSNLRGARELISEWSPLDTVWGPGWGIIGLDGFLLLRETTDMELLPLFLYQSALASIALCIPLLALAKRLKFFALLGVGVFFAVLIYPIYGNWVWGGGWLSQLGTNLGLGHGFIDFAGSGTIHAVGGFVALAGILVFSPRLKKREEPVKPPLVHFPLLALLGTFLLLLGWFGLAVGNPLLTNSVPYVQILLNVLLAACGGVLVSVLYIWFVTGGPDLLMVTRGTVAALVAVSASCAFVPPWAALVIGGIAGLLLPLSIYLLEVKLCLDDPTAAFAIYGISGSWGLLALGIFADGGSGQGWNGVGAREYLEIARQGVSGLLVGAGFQPDWPQQFYAQLVGVVALLIWAFALSWLVFRAAGSLSSRVVGFRAQMGTAAEQSPNGD
jgi:Amt family ammonium transporter